MDAFIAGWFLGVCCGVLLVLMLNDTTDDRMRNVEAAMTERAMYLAKKRQRRIDYARRVRKFFYWS